MKKILLSLLLFYPVMGWATENIIDFKRIEIKAQDKKNICKVLIIECQQNEDWHLYRVKNSSNQFYVISDLKLYQLNKINKNYELLNSWDFSNYSPQKVNTFWATQGDVNEPSDHKFIYPRLFKISENTFAIALIQSFGEMYSGGGMSEERADFFELLIDSKYKLRFQDIPFSVWRMIRACFSYMDFDISMGKCHDDETLVLNIQYLKPYVWQMNYHYYRELSPVSNNVKINERKSYKIQYLIDQIYFPESWGID